MSEEAKVTRVMPTRKDVAYPDGAWTRMTRGREYLLPALSFKLLRKFQKHLEQIGAKDEGGTMGLERMDKVIEVVHGALEINYPDLTKDDVEDLLDMDNFKFVYAALMGVSGLVKRDPAPGEPKAASV